MSYIFAFYDTNPQVTQLVTPPAMKPKNQNHINPPITKAIIAEIRAPARKLFTKVPLLFAIPKPITGHSISEHMKCTKPIISGEELPERIPVDTNMEIKIGKLTGTSKPIQKFWSLISISKLSSSPTWNSCSQMGQSTFPE